MTGVAVPKGVRIGVDLGGTKIECIALGPDGVVLHRSRCATPHGDYPATLRAIADLVTTVETACELPRTAVGLGTPGSVSPFTGLLRNSNAIHMNGRPFAEDLAAALDGRPLRVANDANCFAVSEAADGAAIGAKVVFGVIIGTGVGAGIVIDGAPLIGANGVAGEWGHTKLPGANTDEQATPRCWCGRDDCLETFLCGPALVADYARAGGEGAADGRDVVARAAEGDAEARNALDRFADRLGRALADVVNLIDPDVIVLGGGMSNIDGLADRAHEAMRAHVFSDDIVTRIVINQHGDSSGVRGAAWLWPLEDA